MLRGGVRVSFNTQWFSECFYLQKMYSEAPDGSHFKKFNMHKYLYQVKVTSDLSFGEKNYSLFTFEI